MVVLLIVVMCAPIRRQLLLTKLPLIIVLALVRNGVPPCPRGPRAQTCGIGQASKDQGLRANCRCCPSPACCPLQLSCSSTGSGNERMRGSANDQSLCLRK